MRLNVRHRWISCVGLLAMLSALVAGPVASVAAVSIANAAMHYAPMSHAVMSHAGMSDAGMSQAGTALDVPQQHEHQRGIATQAAPVAGPSLPCQSCPHCPKPCSDHHNCLLKCFQTSSLAPPEGRVERIVVRNVVWPSLSAAVSATAVPPLLRPPSL